MPGISFFVFCTIAFFVDVCLREKKKTEVLGFWEFGAYLTFFPKMISGPITRWETYRKNFPLTRESEKQLWRNLERLMLEKADFIRKTMTEPERSA